MYSAHAWPQAISHRGLRTRAPENSLPAFRAALAAGADAIELDVHASRDGTLFVHHDDAIALKAAGAESTPVRIAQLDSKILSRARLADDVSIPTLDDVLNEVAARALIYIEIKAPGVEADVVRCLRRHASIADSCAVHAFDHRVVKRMLELLPSVRTGILQVAYPIDTPAALRAAGAIDLWQHADYIDTALVNDVRAYGGRVIAWTVNDPAQWERLATIGVYGICTDRIDCYVRWRNAAMLTARASGS